LFDTLEIEMLMQTQALAVSLFEALTRRPAWMRDGACVDAPRDLFFRTASRAVREAKELCARCPVWSECLRHALDQPEEDGVWGGLSARERRPLRRRTARAAMRSGFGTGEGT
jgi:WhiB family redox-sensing transcriptional regulator